MIQLTKKKAQIFYTLVQCFYWLTNGFMYSFATLYLQDLGFSNSKIGIFLGCAYGGAALMQPTLASFITSKGLQIRTSMRAMYAWIAVVAGIVLVVPMPQLVKAVLLVLIFSTQSAAIPCVNTLVKTLEQGGVPVNFGRARGISCITYAIATVIMGQITLVILPKWIPAFYIGSALGMVILMSVCQVPHVRFEETTEKKKEKGARLLKNSKFVQFLVGAGCFYLGLVLLEGFMLQIMQNVQGTSADMSLALSIGSIAELLALFFYLRLRKWFGYRKMLLFAGWAWVLRYGIVMMAASPMMIFASQLMHFCTFAFYTPASLDFMSDVLPAKDFLKGQALLGSICSVGSVFATFLGGILLDVLGVTATIGCIIGVSVLGAICFTLAVRGKQEVSNE